MSVIRGKRQQQHCFLLLLLQCITFADISLAQRSPYSLQAAVDELHRREAAKYPLNAPPSQQHYFGSALGTANEQDYWDDDSDFPANYNKNHNRHRLNKALAKYLERENYDAEHGGLSLGPFGGYEFDDEENINNNYNNNNNNNNNPFNNYQEEKKRSSYFRERDNKYDANNAPASVFRERESQVVNEPERSELTEQFLREIEETQEHDREERYKEALRHLWEKYQQQENEIEGDIFEEKKRMRTPPYYMLMQKKRSYPVLPWLPYAERKKRFPVAKRSTTKRSAVDNTNFRKTNEKVARELSELFGTPGEEKKKRSTDEQTKVLSTHAPDTTSTPINDMHLETPAKNLNATDGEKLAKTTPASVATVEQHQHGIGHAGTHGHSKERKHRKRSDHHSHESHEEEEDSEEHEEHDEHDEEEEDEDDHEDFEEDEDEQRKKKRDVNGVKHSSGELLREDQILPGDINSRSKKSIEWSKYIGLDRKKKSMKRENNRSNLDVKKRSAADAEDSSDDADAKEKKEKRDIDPEKLDNMDKKLQSIEDFIIDETIKYTGAHEGIANPEEIRRLKDHVLSRLATAYSLEKMRRALEKLRQSVDNENHLLRNVIESDDSNESLENQKRLSVKKEKVQYPHDDFHLATNNGKTKEIHSNAMMSSTNTAHMPKNSDGIDGDVGDDDYGGGGGAGGGLQEVRRKKKRTNGYLRYPELPNDFSDFNDDSGVTRYEALNDAYLGNKNYIIGSNHCPIIESMAERCRGVDLLSGDLNQELLPICGVHQICYLCGTSQVACDYQYLSEADTICGNNNDCESAARSVLLILRGTPGPQLGPRECLKNPCLYSAMREIGL